ncbi:MAG: glycosyl hydrolase family 28-related protein [Bryobacterales bacterium]|nr:glycosyl hydrolase family 28-related protein [Bryobacterales bacterium]
MFALPHCRVRLPAWPASLRLLLWAGAVLLLAAGLGAAPQTLFRSVADYGVKGDGAAAETALIQGAIDACAVDGGCTLHFPAGRYVTGTLYFRDNVTLYLDAGAVIATSGSADDYTAPALFYGKGVNGITLTGEGEIQAGPVPAPDETTVRNPGSRLISLVLIENATNVRISGIRFLRSPVWTVTLRVVDGAWLENLLIENAMLASSTNGVVLDSSTRVSVRSLVYRGGGDGITMQTSLVDGIAPPCTGIAISDSNLRSGATAIKVGTATHGDIRNVVVSNTVIESSQGGVGIFARDGGSVESLQFSNLVIETSAVRRGSAEWPIVIDLKRRDEGSQAGSVSGVAFTGVRVHTAGKLLFSGRTRHPIRELSIDGMAVTVRPAAGAPAKLERPWKSPWDAVAGEDEATTAILLGYVADAFVRDLRVSWEGESGSPDSHALFVHSVDGLSLDGITARQGKVGGTLAAMHFLASRNIGIRNSTAPPETGVWVQAQGIGKQDFYLFGNNTAAAYRDYLFVR